MRTLSRGGRRPTRARARRSAAPARMTMGDMRQRLLLLLLHCPTLSGVGSPALRFANTFGDHMVLQAGTSVSIWGHAPAGSEVSVTSSASPRKTTARADANGTWQVALAAGPPSATPRAVVATSGGATAALKDVLFGDVCELPGCPPPYPSVEPCMPLDSHCNGAGSDCTLVSVGTRSAGVCSGQSNMQFVSDDTFSICAYCFLS
eukprot:SAG22_NODE_5355_length_1030_cov_1.365199_1_plen_205_part_00